MVNKYRLSSKSYDRETPNEQITPRKIYFISVEGVATEVEYLQLPNGAGYQRPCQY